MQTKLSLKLLCVPLMGFVLSGCGGASGGSALQNSIDNANNVSSGGASSAFNGNSSASSVSSINTTALSNVGFGTGNAFVAGTIGVGIGTTNLSAGGSTTLIVDAVSTTGNLVTESLTIVFNSPCVASGEAKLSQASVSTTTGEATTTYTAQGCVGPDQITATVSGKSISPARVTITVAADTVQSLTFADATPALINLKGTGGNETSLVRFKVLGATGAPVKGKDVNFALSTQVGGMALTNASAKTDSQGYASTTVQAGTIATSVRVTATEASTLTSTQSSQLLVSTGIPDQKSMSLSTSLFSPAAWDYDNAQVTLTVLLADAFNNFAPDGTTVSFTTEGGAVESGCNTLKGGCSVKWRSQNPRPIRAESDTSIDRYLCITLLPSETYDQCAAKRAGRITILATAIGNESFLDVDGDGYFSPGIDTFKTSSGGGDCNANEPISTADVPPGSSIKSCDDLPEAYLDKDESKVRSSDEPYTDFNSSGTYTGSDGQYNGVLCKTPGNGCTQDKVTIRRELVLVMSCSSPLMDTAGRLPNQPSGITLGIGASASITMVLADCHGNSLPAGTTVTVNSSTASNVVVTNGMSGPLSDGTEPSSFTIFFKADQTKLPTGAVFINVTTPTPSGGTVTTTTTGINLN